MLGLVVPRNLVLTFKMMGPVRVALKPTIVAPGVVPAARCRDVEVPKLLLIRISAEPLPPILDRTIEN